MYAPDAVFSRQLVVQAGYEYALARDYSERDFQQGRDIPEAEVEVLRPVEFIGQRPREVVVFNAYESDSLLADFLNINVSNADSIREFVTRYGLLWGNGERRYTTLDDALPWGYVIHEGNATLEMYQQIRAAQACFYMAELLDSGLSEEELLSSGLSEEETVRRKIEKASCLEVRHGKASFHFSRLGRFEIELKASEMLYSSDPAIEACYQFVFDSIKKGLELFPLVFQAVPYVSNEKARKRIRTYLKADSLMAVIWHQIAQFTASGGNVRQCIAPKCGKWFRFSKPNAQVCSSACSQRLKRQRDAAKAREAKIALSVPNACPTDTA
ncbi:hypothetical protein [Deinococcus aluminii]|uniref:hypothetical protein n=1 Tax=Deinococcus aluminii TaxID=1656885 RepID=UPI0031E9969D